MIKKLIAKILGKRIIYLCSERNRVVVSRIATPTAFGLRVRTPSRYNYKGKYLLCLPDGTTTDTICLYKWSDTKPEQMSVEEQIYENCLNETAYLRRSYNVPTLTEQKSPPPIMTDVIPSLPKGGLK